VDSLIIGGLPPLFEEFVRKRFNLLWRGSRDGFTAKQFHRRCDGRANTLTLIADTDGNVFGGFTPVEWESRKWNGKGGEENNLFKCDNSLRSSLFTRRNPHGVPPRKFAPKEEMKQYAIVCNSALGPVFGGGIVVSDNCNANIYSHTRIGTNWSDRMYANDSAVRGLPHGRGEVHSEGS
jgi:hypothetical protein